MSSKDWNNETIREALSNKTLTLTFTKKDGTERVMKCTRNFDMLLNEADTYGYTVPEGTGCELPDNLLRVWSVDDKGWRIVNVNTVSEVEEHA